jgi:undecaprenyl diphosphate synthase
VARRSMQRRDRPGAEREGARRIEDPFEHPSGARPPQLPPQTIPGHVAVVMDGNGRWANQRGLPRTAGHEAGEAALLDVVAGALQIGVTHLSAYAFSTENWKRSPEEVRFLMGFSRDVLRRQRDTLHSWGVRIRWIGREQRLWSSVIKELKEAERLTAGNTRMTLYMCVNHGGRAEIVDGIREVAALAREGRLSPRAITESSFRRYLDDPEMPDVDLFLRTSGEQRTSNFLLWEAAYAELVFVPELWPDVDRRVLWRAITEYARRDRRYGGAVDAPTPEAPAAGTPDAPTTGSPAPEAPGTGGA